MEIIVGDKGSGKTHKLIVLCKKMNEEAGINNTVIVAKILEGYSKKYKKELKEKRKKLVR